MCLRCCCRRGNRATPHLLRWQSLIRKLRRARRLQHPWHNLGLHLQHLGLSQAFRQRLSRFHPREDWGSTWVIHLRRTRRSNGHPTRVSAVRRELTAQSQRHAQEMDVLRQENAQRLQEVRQEATQAALGAQGMVPAIREMGHAQQTALKEAVQDSRKEKTDGVLLKPKGSESQAYTQVKLNSSRRAGAGCPATYALCIQTYKRCWNGVKTGSKASPQKNCPRRSAMKLMRWIRSPTLPRKAVSWLLHCRWSRRKNSSRLWSTAEQVGLKRGDDSGVATTPLLHHENELCWRLWSVHKSRS